MYMYIHVESGYTDICSMCSVPGGSSPQGSYSQEMPLHSAASGLPPHLPPLLQTDCTQPGATLTGEVYIACLMQLSVWPLCVPAVGLFQEDPNLLTEPNHVILNHLYALSIKVLCDSCSIIELYFSLALSTESVIVLLCRIMC